MQIAMPKPGLDKLSQVRQRAFTMFDNVIEDVTPELVFFRNVVLGELVQNAIRHGQGNISVEVSKEKECVKVAVLDEGRGCTQSALSCSPDCYHGLALVSKVADNVTIARTNRGFKVEAMKYL